MKTCRVCGLELPLFARYCARCGTAFPPSTARGTRNATWLLILFGVAVPVAAAIAIIYSAIALDPRTPGEGNIDANTLRTFSAAIAVAFSGISLLHAGALYGLLRGREWGKVTATIACVLWAFTCVGLPVALLVLNSLWRPRLGANSAHPVP